MIHVTEIQHGSQTVGSMGDGTLVAIGFDQYLAGVLSDVVLGGGTYQLVSLPTSVLVVAQYIDHDDASREPDTINLPKIDMSGCKEIEKYDLHCVIREVSFNQLQPSVARVTVTPLTNGPDAIPDMHIGMSANESLSEMINQEVVIPAAQWWPTN